jgi:hypothetical protein
MHFFPVHREAAGLEFTFATPLPDPKLGKRIAIRFKE